MIKTRCSGRSAQLSYESHTLVCFSWRENKVKRILVKREVMMMISETSASTDFGQVQPVGSDLGAALRSDAATGAKTTATATGGAAWSRRRKLAFFVAACGGFWLLLGFGVAAVLGAF